MSLLDPAAHRGQPAIDPDAGADDPTGAVPRRQCGRCRTWFDGDPDMDPAVRQEWWACATCRAVLLSGSSYGSKQ